MAKYRKLGKTASQRKALLRAQVTSLLLNGKIETTEARAKEARSIAEGLIALAVKEKDNFETVKVKAAGGISSLQDAEDFLALGAERLGTSRIVKIAMEQSQE